MKVFAGIVQWDASILWSAHDIFSGVIKLEGINGASMLFWKFDKGGWELVGSGRFRFHEGFWSRRDFSNKMNDNIFVIKWAIQKK